MRGRAETEVVGAETGGVLQVGGNSRSRGALWAGSGSGPFSHVHPFPVSPPPPSCHFAQFLFASVVLNPMPFVLTRGHVSKEQACGDLGALKGG